MEYVTAGREPAKALRFFEEICRIPHPSGNEEKIADYLEAFAKERGLECLRDASNNVVIKRPGKGAPVILQGHTDMVSAVAPEKGVSDAKAYLAEHGVTPILDGDWLHADGTTLGADDGVAVALMLALLDSPEIETPALECVFTVSEEVGLDGAKALDPSWLQGRRMINLDSESMGSLTVSCAGGCRMKLEREFRPAPYEPKYALRVDISNLKGGHSGGAIDKPHTNAIWLAGRIAGLLRIGGSLAWIRGGEADNAIPRSASALVCYPNEALMLAAEKRFMDLLPLEVEGEPTAEVSVTRAEPEPSYADTEDLFELIANVPRGVQSKNEQQGFVVTSLNCGVIKSEGGKVTLTFALRSSIAAELEALKEKVSKCAESYGFSAEPGAQYPGWAYAEVSPLRDTVCEVWHEMTGGTMTVFSIHGGLECGIFCDRLPGLDVVALGPTTRGAHTPEERLYLPSYAQTWELIVKVLGKLIEK